MTYRNARGDARAGLLGRRLLAGAVLASLVGAGLAAPAAADDADELVVAPGVSAAGDWGRPGAPGTAAAGFTVEELPEGGTLYLALDAASPGGTGGYRARVKVEPDGGLVVGTSKVVDGREGWYSSTPVEGEVEPGDVVNLEADFTGAPRGDVLVRAWPSDETRPDWQHDLVDDGEVPVTSTLVNRTWGYLSSGASGSVSVEVGDVREQVVAEPVHTGGKPGAATTGVPDGTKLTRHDGDLVITTPGARYDSLDVHGFVVVRAPDVTITRSLIRGGRQTGNRGLVTVDDSRSRNFTIEDSTLKPDHPSVWYDGIKGSGFTARRVDISGTVDNIKIYGDDVLVEDSWLHDSRWFASDPNQGGGPTHNDGVQVLGGSRITFRGNSITGASNGAVQVTQDYSPVMGLTFVGNWLSGGTCSVKINHKGEASRPQVAVRDNRFGLGQSIAGCAVLATSRTDLSSSGNVWDATSLPIVVTRFG
ncbi:hypothetical protein [Pseudokineococcus sp. 5B2Z-1]|uniref:hypothetical protein n=1 Tax=Pseudokineococcus sp. 5B2Z-1 TaxID=3132744 RepID=UPI0030DCF70C